MSESKLATYQHYSPNYSARQGRIVGISIHCTAGSEKHTARQIVDISRFSHASASGASTTYAVGGDGSIAQGLQESRRQWCTSNQIDHWVVSIEVASNMDGTVVTDKAYAAAAELCVDICKRNGIKKLIWDESKKDIVKNWKSHPEWHTVCNLVPHRWFANKSCPGPFLYSQYGEIAANVNRRLKEDEDMTEAQVRRIVEEMMGPPMDIIEDEIKSLNGKVNEIHKTYNTVEECPEWSRETIQRLVDKGVLKGDGHGLGLTDEMVRMLVMLWRSAVI